MDWGLRGKVVLVTGGASGIGRGIAESFGKEGAYVLVTYFTSKAGAIETTAAIENSGGKALTVQADLTQEAEVERIVTTALEYFGSVDVLVANSGGLIQRSPVAQSSRELWDQALAVNLTSTFLCCRAVLPYMERAGEGNIITVSSLAAHHGGGKGASHYATAKGGVITFTRALAKEVGPDGIRVNGIAPGMIATQFHDHFSTPEGRQEVVNRTPLRREGLPDDVANAALFLASPYSTFITGEVIEVNGGQGTY